MRWNTAITPTTTRTDSMATITTFTPKQRDMGVSDALNDPDLRLKVLGYVAAKRGISTGAALTFITGQLSREVGAIVGHRDNVTLGHMFDHLDHPNLDGPGSSGAMLDHDIRQLFADRAGLNRVVEAISKDQAVDYLAALTKLHEGVDEARGGTVRMALAAARLPTDGIEAGLRLLERRDAAADRAYFRALGPVEQTDARGLVLLDQGPGGGAPVDVGKALADPVEIERRLARIRRAQAGWEGDDGRARFLEADRANLEANRDIVATAERAGKIAAARSQANQVARRLDQAIREETDPSRRMRVLDAEIAKLGGDVAPARAVDVPATKGLRALDAPAGGTRTLSPELQCRIIRLLEQGEPYDEALKRVILTAERDGEPVWQGDALVAAPVPAVEPPVEPTVPEGVHAGSHELEGRIQARLRRDGKVIDGKVASGEYVRTLEQIMAEDRAASMGEL